MTPIHTMTAEEQEEWLARGGVLVVSTWPWPRRAHVPAHGTYSEYANHGCRCEPCTDANRNYNREWYRKNRDRVLARRRELEALDAKWRAL